MRNIDYGIINDAQLFYSDLGYKNVTAPWKIPEHICEIVSGHKKQMIGSAEQSLYYMRRNNMLQDNIFYQATTPCFRYTDPVDKTHVQEFMKLELIIFNPVGNRGGKILQDAKKFFSQFHSIHLTQEDHGYDININDIEVGSYYSKTVENNRYACGTGVALPRLQVALATGYANSYIKKGVLGDVSKIQEEYEEFIDAVKQNNPIMAQVELSDLIGAIKYWAKKYNCSLSDLMTMSDVTERVFKEGVRK